MPQIIIRDKTGGGNRLSSTNDDSSDQITVTGSQVIVDSGKSVTVTFSPSQITVDLAE